MKNVNQTIKSEVESVTGRDMNNSSIYLPECDSNGIPLLKRIEKYPDLPETEFIPIEYVHPTKGIVPNNYHINKLGTIINIKTGAIFKPKLNIKGYSLVGIIFSKVQRSIPVHRLVASTFLKNPDLEVYSVVNHINHVRDDNKLSNLEWITPVHNSNKKSGKALKIDESKLVQYVATNPVTGKEVFRINKYNCPDFINLASLIATIGKNTKTGRKTYQGYVWEKDSSGSGKDRNKFQSIIGFSGNLEDYNWYRHWKYPKLYVCEEGFIRKGTKILGTLDEKNYVCITYYDEKGNINIKGLRAHRIIAEFLLKRDLEKDEVVDHINTIPYDNNFSNLRVCSQKENMHNPITMNKLTNKLILTDKLGNFISYGTAKELSEIIYKDSKFNRMSYGELLRTNFPGDEYICISLENKENLTKKMEKVVYVFSEDKKLILGVFRSKNDLLLNFKINGINLADKTILKYLNADTSYKNCFIMQGKTAVDIVLSLGNGNALKFTESDIKSEDINKIKSIEFNPDDYIKVNSSDIIDDNRKGISRFDYFGKFVKTYSSRSELNREVGRNISIEVCTRGDRLTSLNSLWCDIGDENKIKNDLRYIFYKFNEDKEVVDVGLSLNYFSCNDSSIFKKLKKYVNTGIPAPDGYYYQQGDPENMLYDPENTELIKKRDIIKWKPKNNKEK